MYQAKAAKKNKEKKDEHNMKVAVSDKKKAAYAAKQRAGDVAQGHAPAYKGMVTRSRARESVPEAPEVSSPSVTSSEDEPPSYSGKPRVPVEESDSDENEQGELYESDSQDLISDSDNEYDESDISNEDDADETQEQPASVPIHPTPELDKARNIARQQILDEDIFYRPTARPKGGTAGYTRADHEHMPQCHQAEFSHSSCLKKSTTRKKEKHIKPDDQWKSRIDARLTSRKWCEKNLAWELRKAVHLERKMIFDAEKAAREKGERFQQAK